MKFHNQMIKKTYDHTAQILDMLEHDTDLKTVRSFEVEKKEIYRAVRNDYFCRGYALNRIDFFSNPKYYKTMITEMAIEIQQGVGMAETNMILYNVSKIIDQVIYNLRSFNMPAEGMMNVGFVGIDIEQKQLVITNIENHMEVIFQLMLDRNVNPNSVYNSSFMYFVKFRYLGRFSAGEEVIG